MSEFSIKGTETQLLKSKKIALGITGSVACVRAPQIARDLMRQGAEVYPVMTKSAQKLIGKDLLEWACENEVVTELTGKIEHVKLGAGSDLVLVCPSTANTLSKIAQGIDDTTVTSTVTCALGEGVPLIIVPAMHESMYTHPIVRENIEKLESMGVSVIKPRLEEGKAKIASNKEIANEVMSILSKKDLEGKKIVITGGPTYERIDACRGIINQSSGKMACALAEQAEMRGADVAFVYGPGKETPRKAIKVTNAEEMIEKTLGELADADVLISVAAIADYSPKSLKGKLDSGKELALELKKNPKLLELARKKFPDKTIIGFKLEENIDEEKAGRLLKTADLVVANSVKAINAETTEVLIKSKEKSRRVKASKRELAGIILDEIK